MADTNLNVRIKNAYKTESEWTQTTTIPKLGEVLYTKSGTHDGQYKIGDGTHKWSELSYVQASGGLQNLVDGSNTGSVRGIGALNENSYKTGSYALAEGYGTWARGVYSHAEGYGTRANETASHAEGYNTSASGSYSHVEGYNTTASGNYSHAEGKGTTDNDVDPVLFYPKVLKGYISTAVNPEMSDPYDPTYHIYTLHMTEGKITDVFVGNKFAVVEPNKITGVDYPDDPGVPMPYYGFGFCYITYINYETGEIWIGDDTYERIYQPPYINNANVSIFMNGIAELAWDSYQAIGELPEYGVVYDGSGNIKITSETNIANELYDIDDSQATIITLSSSTLDIHLGDFICYINTGNTVLVIDKLNSNRYVVNCLLTDELSNNKNEDFAILRGICTDIWGYAAGAYGEASHSGGYETSANGNYSFTSGAFTRAFGKSQLVVGEYNEYDQVAYKYISGTGFTNGEDKRSKYAFIIGNGTDNQHRSNALAVDWYGNLEINGDITLLDGKGLYSEDSTGRTFGMIADNGDNLWIGAGSSNFPHHSGVNGFTHISSGYNTTNNTGNSTIYVSVPSLSGTTWSHTAYGVLHTGNYSNYALPLSGGILTGNLVIGSTSDTVGRNLTIRNSLGNVALTVGTDGAHGLYSNTKGGFILYVNKDNNNTNNRLYIPRPVSVTGNLIATTGIGVGKTTQQEAKAGFWANSAGNLYLTGDANTGSYIYFYYNKAVSATSYIRESAANELYTNAYLAAKDYSGNVRRVITSYATDGQRVATLGAVGTQTLYISGQWSTTGTTYTSKTITVSSSDKRLKENIKDTEVEALPIINRMKIREFDWTDGRDDKHQIIGMVADELEKIDDRLAAGGGEDEEGNPIYKSVDTFYLTGYLTKAIQELSKENQELKERIKRLESR